MTPHLLEVDLKNITIQNTFRIICEVQVEISFGAIFSVPISIFIITFFGFRIFIFIIFKNFLRILGSFGSYKITVQIIRFMGRTVRDGVVKIDHIGSAGKHVDYDS